MRMQRRSKLTPLIKYMENVVNLIKEKTYILIENL